MKKVRRFIMLVCAYYWGMDVTKPYVAAPALPRQPMTAPCTAISRNALTHGSCRVELQESTLRVCELNKGQLQQFPADEADRCVVIVTTHSDHHRLAANTSYSAAPHRQSKIRLAQE